MSLRQETPAVVTAGATFPHSVDIYTSVTENIVPLLKGQPDEIIVPEFHLSR